MSDISVEDCGRDPIRESLGTFAVGVCRSFFDWLCNGDRVVGIDSQIYISHDDADYPGQFVLTSQGILVSQPDHISHRNISLSSVSLASHKEVRTSQLVPFLLEFADLCLNTWTGQP